MSFAAGATVGAEPANPDGTRGPVGGPRHPLGPAGIAGDGNAGAGAGESAPVESAAGPGVSSADCGGGKGTRTGVAGVWAAAPRTANLLRGPVGTPLGTVGASDAAGPLGGDLAAGTTVGLCTTVSGSD